VTHFSRLNFFFELPVVQSFSPRCRWPGGPIAHKEGRGGGRKRGGGDVLALGRSCSVRGSDKMREEVRCKGAVERTILIYIYIYIYIYNIYIYIKNTPPP
jgi:hypothetical protein